MPKEDLNIVALRYYSIMNPFIDLIVMVPADFEELAAECIYQTLHIDFWDDSDERFYCCGYCDYIYDEFKENGIPYSVACLQDFNENEFLFENYAQYIVNSGMKYVDIAWGKTWNG